MPKGLPLYLGAALLAAPALVALAQISISPPTGNPPATAPAATAPAPAANGATLPTAQSVLESLLNEKTPATYPATVTTTNPSAVATFKAAAPNEPKAVLIPEGQFIWKRTGHLVKDEKTGTYFFSFEADGKSMADPPIAILPSHLLGAMEDASNKGALPVTFRITAEVTEYHNKNYLYIRDMQAVMDLNQGIGR